MQTGLTCLEYESRDMSRLYIELAGFSMSFASVW
jgi:hypothetical protein